VTVETWGERRDLGKRLRRRNGKETASGATSICHLLATYSLSREKKLARREGFEPPTLRSVVGFRLALGCSKVRETPNTWGFS
jgi:hypothetical protein